MTIPAVFTNGVFRPLTPPTLAEGTKANVYVSTPSTMLDDSSAADDPDLADFKRRLAAVKNMDDMMAFWETLPEGEDDSYDPEAWIAETRRLTGNNRVEGPTS